MQEFYTYISQRPRFRETCEGGREGRKKKEKEEKKGSGDTRDLISYSSVFASVSGRFHRSELLICSLHSICSACHSYRIICRDSRPLEEAI